MRALIVDDSRAMRTVISRIVGGLGFEVAQASDGKQALDQLRNHALPDLLLSDWNMPEMDGYELVRAVRAVDAYAGIKIVMVTTETEVSRISVLLDKLRLLGLAGG